MDSYDYLVFILNKMNCINLFFNLSAMIFATL